jgi:putative transcriptional regulator
METQDFSNLVQGLKEAAAMRRGELAPAGRVVIEPVDVKKIRKLTGQSQADFSRMLWISARTLQNWEQGRNHPSGPALALLRAIAAAPGAVVAALNDSGWMNGGESERPPRPAISEAGISPRAAR